MLIALDLDGCLANFVHTLSEVAYNHFGIRANPSSYGEIVPVKYWGKIYDYMIDCGAFLSIPVYEENVRILADWSKEHTLYYLTRRRPASPLDQRRIALHQSQTRRWVMKVDLPQYYNLVFVQDKGDWCVRNGCSCIVEDYLKDCRKWEGLMTSNGFLKAWLIDRPWNQGSYSRRVKNFSEVKLD